MYIIIKFQQYFGIDCLFQILKVQYYKPQITNFIHSKQVKGTKSLGPTF